MTVDEVSKYYRVTWDVVFEWSAREFLNRVTYWLDYLEYERSRKK